MRVFGMDAKPEATAFFARTQNPKHLRFLHGRKTRSNCVFCTDAKPEKRRFRQGRYPISCVFCTDAKPEMLRFFCTDAKPECDCVYAGTQNPISPCVFCTDANPNYVLRFRHGRKTRLAAFFARTQNPKYSAFRHERKTCWTAFFARTQNPNVCCVFGMDAKPEV